MKKPISGNDLVKFDRDKFFFSGQTLIIALDQIKGKVTHKYVGEVIDGTLFAEREPKQFFKKSKGWGFNIYLFKRSKTFGIKRIDLRAVLPDGKKFHGRISVSEVKKQLVDGTATIKWKEKTGWDTQIILQPRDFE